ncbi:ClpP/crotonase, partial [Caulochytrium protostelioides]
ETRVLLLTGNGRFYSSGQALAPPPGVDFGDPIALKKWVVERVEVTKTVVDRIITFPKPIVVAANGPAMGFAVTSMALADAVYSVPDAHFSTPFMQLALCVEGCSSITFPERMGYAKANELLLLGKRFTAHEFERYGLVNEVVPADQLEATAMKAATQFADTHQDALLQSRELIMRQRRPRLLQQNRDEMDLLIQRMLSAEFFAAMMNFISRKQSTPASKL